MTLEKIKELVQLECNVDFSKKTRLRRYVEAKGLYCELATRYTDLSLTEVGEVIGIDHSTIVHYRKKEFYAGYSDYTYTEQRKRLLKFMELDRAKQKGNTEMVNLLKEQLMEMITA